MQVTIKDLEALARLARLKFTDAEAEKLLHDLNKIIQYIETLNEIAELDETEPLENINAGLNEFRDDEVTSSVSRDEALMNAPDKTDMFFKVPKVIDR